MVKPQGDNIKTVKTKPFDITKDEELLKFIYDSKRDIDDLIPYLVEYIKKKIKEFKLTTKYKLIFLYDPEGNIGDYSANKIYQALLEGEKKDILLLLLSKGGSVEPAYKISRNCKEYSDNKFIVAIPSKAKSASTLIALGADEIHMGSTSELGPIDPQIGGLPALGVMGALDYLASLCEKYPKSGGMLASYLTSKLDLGQLGYFQRISESSVLYGEKLLEGKTLPKPFTAKDVATRLVTFYKDHSFVIDKDEAKKYLGDCVKSNSSEYKFANEIHKLLNTVQLYSSFFKKKNISIIGSISDVMFFDK